MWIERSRVSTLGPLVLQTAVFVVSLLLVLGVSLSPSNVDAMQKIKQNLKFSSGVSWSDADPCKWEHVQCSNNEVTRIQLGHQKVSGTLSSAIVDLTNLDVLELMGNELTGPLPSFKGLRSLKTLNLQNNQFESIPPDFFDGLTSLSSVFLDNNPFSPWSIPGGLQAASSLTYFSANSANVVGTIPDFFNSTTFPSLTDLHMSSNLLQGTLPSSFASLISLKTLWLNGQVDKSGARTLNGTIEVLKGMTGLVQIWLNFNGFTGPIPDLSGLSALEHFNLRDNSLTGPVPPSLTKMTSLKVVNLTNNALQGPTPKFSSSVAVDMRNDTNRFCLSEPGVNCNNQVNTLISVMEPFGYPFNIANEWKGNDSCQFKGISCLAGNISVINLQYMNLSGTISPNFAALTSLKTLNLAHNSITGTIPEALTKIPTLTTLDLSYNHLDVRKAPSFTHTTVNFANNDGDKKISPPIDGNSPGSGPTGRKGSRIGVIVGAVVASVCVIFIAAVLIFYFMKKKRFYGGVKSDIHPNHSGSDVALKYMGGKVGGGSYSQGSSGPSDIHLVETNNMIIPLEVLRSVTNNFSNDKILGRGGFGTVYKGELPDGTKIAVKRMSSGAFDDKGLGEFKSEIAVLSKVRHRHLVSLLGFCLEGNEKILVYEYLPEGTLSSHLFSWKEEGLKPLEWKQRLTISLDVARGVEYLHSLAHQSFIHRDLKPSNILLGDDMRAKVADFGLVRLVPDGINTSIPTRIAGTFGYLAPEYAVTGRITTKVDIFSFGVILMEMITGLRALDNSQPADFHLVTWFRRMYISKDTFSKAIDATIDLDEETLASVNTVAELACHCSAREPNQRPEMGHVVNVLSSLAHKWKPTEDNSEEDVLGIDTDMSLPQFLKRWQALEDSYIDNTSSSTYVASRDNTETSIPTRPSGFGHSLASLDGR